MRHNRAGRFGWILAILAAMSLLAVACSSDDDDDTATEDTAEETTTTEAEAETTEATEAETTEATEAETTEATEAETTEATEAEAAEGAIGIDLGEWFVTPSGDVSAGTVTFSVTNSGPDNPHAFAIVKGDSYEDLPQKDNGAVDTDTVGDAFLGNTDNLEVGESTEIEFELEAGNYVFFCPIEFGPNSHAAAGQVLSVTVG